MAKRVTETSAGASIAAWVVLRPGRKQEHVATIQAHYGNSGAVTVDVYNYRDDNPSQGYRQGRAGGYGYDKFTAAISGIFIDGHEISDHCRYRKPVPKSGAWKKGAKAPKGWHFANWSSELEGYTSCYRQSGLDYLRALGYRIISAI